MIANQKQYKITVDRLEEVDRDLSNFDEISHVRSGIDPIIIAAQRRSLESERGRMSRDVERYLALREGRIDALHSKDISGLGVALIEARLALGLTQKELSIRLNIKEQQVQRYEQERYQSASLSRIQEVAQALEADTSVELKLSSKIDFELDDFDPRLLPVREMKKRGWFNDLRVPSDVPKTDLALAEYFMRAASAGSSTAALHRQRVRLGGKVNPYAVSAWKARVLQKARRKTPRNVNQTIDALFIRDLVNLSAAPDGPLLAIQALEGRGVAVVVERHLTGTHLDGAAMLLDNKIPVIGLTIRHVLRGECFLTRKKTHITWYC